MNITRRELLIALLGAGAAARENYSQNLNPVEVKGRKKS